MNRITLTWLLVADDRPARRRLAGIVAGVMVGATLFLTLLAAIRAFPGCSMCPSWAFTVFIPGIPGQLDHTDLRPDHTLTAGELAVTSNFDVVDNWAITVLRMALPEPGTTSVKIPDSDIVPKPGEYLAFPALVKRTASLSTNQLGDRYGKQVGVLSLEAVEEPDLLVTIVGTGLGIVSASDFYIPPQMATSFQDIPYENEVYRIATIVGAIAVLMPTLLLIGIVTGLGVAQRAERFATLHLIGATSRQVARTAALEIGAITFAGALAGMALCLALIPLAAQIALKSSRFYYSNLLRSLVNTVLIIVVTTMGMATMAWWRTRRANLGPLGGSCRRAEHRSRLISLMPVVLGTTRLISTSMVAHRNSDLTVYLLPVSSLYTMLGLPWARPVLTWWVARGGRVLAHSVAQVIGSNRITQHPRAIFRAVMGVVVAVYAMTMFAVAITVAAGTRDVTRGGGHPSPTSLEMTPAASDEGTLDNAIDRLVAVPGVTMVAVGGINRGSKQDSRAILEANKIEALGTLHVESPDGTVSVSTRRLYENVAASSSPVSAEELASAYEHGASIILASIDPASPGAIERARIALATLDLTPGTAPTSPSPIQTLQDTATENQFAQPGYIDILIAAGISVVSLGVSTMAALLRCRRVLGLLRLVGMPVMTLRPMMSYEMMLPAVIALAMNIGLGWLTARALVGGVSGRYINQPGGDYWLALGACLALVVVATPASTRYGRHMLAGATVRFGQERTDVSKSVTRAVISLNRR